MLEGGEKGRLLKEEVGGSWLGKENAGGKRLEEEDGGV